MAFKNIIVSLKYISELNDITVMYWQWRFMALNQEQFSECHMQNTCPCIYYIITAYMSFLILS